MHRMGALGDVGEAEAAVRFSHFGVRMTLWPTGTEEDWTQTSAAPTVEPVRKRWVQRAVPRVTDLGPSMEDELASAQAPETMKRRLVLRVWREPQAAANVIAGRACM